MKLERDNKIEEAPDYVFQVRPDNQNEYYKKNEFRVLDFNTFRSYLIEHNSTEN